MALLLGAIAILTQLRVLTIESPGISLGELVKQMAQQSGRPLVVSEELEPQRVVVRMNAVPIDEAMKALTQQELGKWVETGKRITFEPDEDARERLSRTENEALLQSWQHKLDRMQEKMGPESFTAEVASKFAAELDQLTDRRNKGDLSDFVRLEEAGYQLPCGRALVRSLAAIGPARLGQRPTGVVEFSSDPDSLQQPIGDNVSSILESYKREQKQWNEAQESKPGKVGLIAQGGAPVDISRATGLILKISMHGANGVAVLVPYDSDGNVLTQSVSTLGVDGVKALQDEEKRDIKNEKGADWQDLPQLSIDLYRVCEERVRDEQIRQIWKNEKPFRDALEHPEIADLDGLIYGHQVLAMARSKNLNILVPEIARMGAFLPKNAIKDGQLNVNVLKSMLDPSSMSTDLAGWYMIQNGPKLTAEYGEETLSNPTSLGDLVRGGMSAKELLLDDVAPLFVGTHNRFAAGGLDFRLVSNVIKAVRPDLPGWPWFNNDPLPLAFYGSLSSDQRQAAAASGLPLAALTSENWDPLLRDPWMLEHSIAIPSLPKGGSDSIQSDPFVFFGRTDSKAGNLHFEISEEPTVGEDTDGFMVFQDAKTWPQRHRKNSERGNHDAIYRVAHRRSVKMIFSFANQAQMSFTLTCDDPSGPRVNSYGDLPSEIKALFPLPAKQ